MLTSALQRQNVRWRAVREVTRVAAPEHEAAWASAVAGNAAHEIEQVVAGLPFGSPPGARPDPEPLRHVLHFEGRAEMMVRMREAQAKLARDAGHGLSQDDILQRLAHAVLGRSDDARAPNQVQRLV